MHKIIYNALFINKNKELNRIYTYGRFTFENAGGV